MKSKGQQRIGLIAGSLLGLALQFSLGCQSRMKPERSINQVLAAHDRELLSIPGVVGVYVGGSSPRSQVLKVMLAHDDASVRRQIPKQLEGYPVVVEVTGAMKPLR